MKHPVSIRPITEADTDKIVKWRNAPSVMEHFIYRTTLTREDHLNWFHNRVQTGAGTNLALYSNPEVDAALEASNAETDIAKRAEYISIVQKCMSEDMPMVFLMENGGHYPIRQDIVGTPYDVPELAASSEMTYTAFTAK